MKKVNKDLYLQIPIEITRQEWPENYVPVISVFNWVYNHKDYVRESIESILLQKTTFPIEIIIHDDASNDGTKEIILEYQNKYPNLFRNILNDENQYSQEKSVMVPLFDKPRGKYIALAHGDDYWNNPLKLQKQYDFLEMHTDYSLCFHKWLTNISNDSKSMSFDSTIKYNKNSKFTIREVILHGGGLMSTNSMVFHKSYIIKHSKWIVNAPIGDLPLMLILALNGKIGFINEIMSVYNKESSINSWSFKYRNSHFLKIKYVKKMLLFWAKFNSFTSFKYFNIIIIVQVKLLRMLLINYFKYILKQK